MPKDQDNARKDRDEQPHAGDTPEEALEKSGSVDTRIPDGSEAPTTSETMIAGAPAAYVPQMGTGLPAATTGDLGEGEAVLEQERKAQRASGDIQRG